MCGISGVIWRAQDRPAARHEVERMNAMQFHRGPDGGGVFTDGNVALGHRRLSILDLSELGKQPMTSADGRYTITFNGEIYNYRELRGELAAAGYTFRSSTDTEVLLAAYALWGEACVSRLNGMWAFAIYDRDARTVFLSRDRFGIKPLYVVDDAQRFAFASEMKALLAAFPDLRDVNYAMLRYFLPWGSLHDGPETFFNRIESVPPAHNLIVELASGRRRSYSYWSVDPEAFARKWVGTSPVDDLDALLQSAIQLHMRADVPVGTCLSGGLDSSTIVALMSERHPEKIRTYSGLYKGREYDEEIYVDAVNRHLGCVGEGVRRQPDGDLLDDLATITWHQDTPSAGPGLYTQFNVMERASRDVKVILDGQGGDELFAGYLPYYQTRINDLFRRGGVRPYLSGYWLMAAVWKHHGTKWLNGVDDRFLVSHSRAFLARHRKRFGSTPAPQAVEPAFFHPDLAANENGAITRSLGTPYADELSNVLYNHTMTQSIPALLHYEDRNSMAFSVEARVPFLDYRIVEFAMGLDPAYKIRNTWTKWILRKVAAPRLPASVTWRRSKLGYPTPANRWIRSGRDAEHMRDLLFSRSFLERNVVTREAVEFYWREHQEGRSDRSWLLYRYATMELWFRHFIDRLEPRTARPVPGPALAATA
ncbi:asparagine synthase (glutamine-hydrolyzing) [Methylobacterium sp. J-070]|uniref:asparagine synthase (glutamine-hydrolyzing) n=1 Tax=Methylobacterium sp. J-070 TaxID=2836650 RepID=UPI001FBB15E7|nr:asparagine synthase (glutamine-hydrolyzing) [Methylobacterium sp. J-070]MCJ2054926.1 asparagine synthase (glutamine-hydrolyzing) [Methylobacterium sp. J-070]